MNKRIFWSIGMSLASSVGVISTAYLASKATLKSKETLESSANNKEKLERTWKNYIPTALSTGATIAVICYSNLYNYKSVNAILGNYILINQKYKEFKKQTLNQVGKEQYKQIEDSVLMINCEPPLISIGNILDGDDDKYWKALPSDELVLFCDTWSGKCFKSTKANILSAEYHLNRNYILSGWTIPLSMWYDFLGVAVENGSVEDLYWALCDNYVWIDFTHRVSKTANGELFCKIEMLSAPMPEAYWEEYY